MGDLKLLGEFYFSQLLKKPIVNAKGVRVGRVIEMVIRWDSNTPHVTGIIHNKNLHKLIPIEMVAGWDSDCLKLTLACDEHALRQPTDDETFVGKWLLDKQLIDLKGSKLVRVNDLKLAWVSVEDQQLLVLTAVDIGVRGLLRRLGFGAWLDSNGDSLVGWQFIKPLENRTSHLQLTEDKQQLKQLHPADIADILETMGYRQRASFLTSLDSKQAVDA
ncbi:MAG TPA: PRC-barrel domain-containing protein, partial [Verrucomicrobiae bacterium]|nr:PRC-barrel domain-containing protein [Verrucomicrobiae bacterium]